jgi:hypothetical protein
LRLRNLDEVTICRLTRFRTRSKNKSRRPMASASL